MAEHTRPSLGKSYGWTASIYSAAERLSIWFRAHASTARVVANAGARNHHPDPWRRRRTFPRSLGATESQRQDNRRRPLQRMSARAAERVGACPNAHFAQQDASEFLAALPQTRTYDAIVTLFVLDCLTASEVQLLVHQAAARLAPNGGWLWADFAIPSSGPFRLIARMMLTLLYCFFRATTDTSGTSLVDTTPHFEATGLRVVTRASGMFGMVETQYLQSEPRAAAQPSHNTTPATVRT